jgi:hypothetical protein
MGYSGNLFYIGKSNFTGSFLNPQICPKCFKEKAEFFFKYFKDITGYNVVLIETIIDKQKIKTYFDRQNAFMRTTKYLSIYHPYHNFLDGSYNEGWYLNFLKGLVEYLSNGRICDLLIKGGILSLKIKNYKI